MHRPLILAATVAALTASALTAASPAQAAKPSAAVPAIDWQPCEPSGYECATALVPLDYDEPSGPKIELALVRRPADDPGARQGTLFVNPGGPGGSGVSFVRSAGEQLTGPEVRRRFDIVGVDPRGIGGSTPLQCFDTESDIAAVLPPFRWPTTDADWDVQHDTDLKLAAACRGKAGPIINHTSTANFARDLDLLRQAVGDSELNFLGYSYGTYVGETYASLFPNKVGAVVIDGVLNPVRWSTGENWNGWNIPTSARLGSDVGADATLKQFFARCDAAGTAGCAFAGGSAARYQALLASLKADPFPWAVNPDTGEVTFWLTDQVVIGATLQTLYHAQAYASFAGLLKLTEDRMRDERGLPVTTSKAAPGLSAAYYGSEQFWGVICGETAHPGWIGPWKQAAANSVGIFGPLWASGDAPCETWPGFDSDRYYGPFDKATKNPVLVASTRYDPATDYAGAKAVAAMLPNSALLTVEGYGHTTAGTSVCAADIVDSYLLTRRTPSRSMTCQADADPFATSAPALSAASATDLVEAAATGDAGDVAKVADRIDPAAKQTAQQRRLRELREAVLATVHSPATAAGYARR